MNANRLAAGIDTRVRLSMLWVFVLFNIVYADILSLMDPTSPIRRILEGNPMPPGGLLAGAILMETTIAMVVLSWVLTYKANRWVTMVIGAINIFAVASGGHGLYYMFFAAIEIVSMLLIIWFAWKWKPVVTPNIN